MRPLRDDTQLILDGEVRVYRRANSRRWQAAFVIDGRLCCPNRLNAEFPLSPDGLIPQLP